MIEYRIHIYTRIYIYIIRIRTNRREVETRSLIKSNLELTIDFLRSFTRWIDARLLIYRYFSYPVKSIVSNGNRL